ncbi:MAG: GH3 auxin-responsive promoter family protein [Phycisphaeraceae bacterium]|nr:GH3 auxin-responsive promoter family protein [Phycisphaeraceae bacterium]
MSRPTLTSKAPIEVSSTSSEARVAEATSRHVSGEGGETRGVAREGSERAGGAGRRRSGGGTRIRRWTGLVGGGLRVRLGGRIRRLGDAAMWTDRTAAIQRSQLRRLVVLARDTWFGKRHDFACLARLNDDELVDAYRKTVPVADYSAFRAPIDEMREYGRPDVLWPGLVMDFAQTSGTTAGDKFIPVSSQMMRSNYLAAMDIFAYAARFGISLPFLTSGRALFLGGSSDLTTNRHGVRTGDLSGIVTPLIRWPISEIYSPGKEIALMNHWPSKIEAMARECLRQDIRMINGMPSWALVLMDRVLELAREEGTIGPRDGIDRVWPNLTLFVHGGVKYSPFEARIRQRYSGTADGPDIPYRLELYPASEGFIAIQDTPRDPGLRLLTDIGNFYEFIPLDEIDDALAGKRSAGVFTCDRVEPGVRYVVCMSTCAGLWRYVIGDVVEFDSSPRDSAGRGGWSRGTDGVLGPAGPARLRIVGRHRHFINAFGENLIVEHIENAVAKAAAEIGVAVGEFTAAPVYPTPTTRPGLELAVEVPDSILAAWREGPASSAAFRDAFDVAIKAQNVDYTTKRTDDVGMAPPTVTPLAMGTFHRWLESRGKLGGQHKCPRCANHRDIIEGVIGVACRGAG